MMIEMKMAIMVLMRKISAQSRQWSDDDKDDGDGDLDYVNC